MSPSCPLSALLVLTDRRAAEACGRTLVATVAGAVEGGARAVLVREKDLQPAARARLAADLRRALEGSGARLGIASDAGLAARIGLDWVHLAARDPWPQEAGAGLLVGQSCHNAAEVGTAVAERCAYVTVSPVAPSASKPGYGPALGVGRLGELCRLAAPTAVFGLGGVDATNAPSWLAAGARGVAVMGGVMAAADPTAATRRLLDALDQEVSAL